MTNGCQWFILCAIVLMAAMIGCSAPAPPELVAPWRSVQPELDGVTDTLWESVPVTTVQVQGGTPGKLSVHLQAFYTDQHLYLLCRWPDSTESVQKKQWRRIGAAWSQSAEDEDRFALLFAMGNTRARFSKEGCKRYCHKDFMATKLESERADMWHWKAARTNPVAQIDDKHLVYAVTRANDGGRRGDERVERMVQIGDHFIEAGHYVENIDAAAAQPAFMHHPRSQDSDRRFLRNHEATPFDPQADLDAVPGYVLGPHEGSRGDIRAKGRHANGVWTLEIQRLLNTGHEDDVAFRIGRNYPFGVAIHDNAGGDEHSWATKPVLLRLEPRSPAP